jgi:xylose isomerase
LQKLVDDRYAGWTTPFGQTILSGRSSFGELEAYVLANGEPTRASGRQEFIENLINEFVL